MSARVWLEERLREGPPILLDGALGTELERLGVRSELPLWTTHALLEAPDRVATIQRAYAQAGAEILTAATFRTQRHTLARAGLAERAAALTRQAIELARAAAEAPLETARRAPRIWVAGSATTLEDCYRPDLVPDDDTLQREHRDHAENLVAGGADMILVETINSLREARAAGAAASATSLPFLMSFVASPSGQLLSGEPLRQALQIASDCGAAAVLVNCLPIPSVAACLAALRATRDPHGVYPNLGAPQPDGGWGETRTPAEFAREMLGFVRRGARIVGGCCGTTPEHIAGLADALRGGPVRS